MSIKRTNYLLESAHFFLITVSIPSKQFILPAGRSKLDLAIQMSGQIVILGRSAHHLAGC